MTIDKEKEDEITVKCNLFVPLIFGLMQKWDDLYSIDQKIIAEELQLTVTEVHYLLSNQISQFSLQQIIAIGEIAGIWDSQVPPPLEND
jgi:predicted XRE-type DNA-binding protein